MMLKFLDNFNQVHNLEVGFIRLGPKDKLHIATINFDSLLAHRAF